MYLDYTPEQVALRDRIRATMTRLMTAELRAEIHATEGGGPLYLKAMAELGGEGWLGIGWPKAYGGQEQGPIEQFIFFDEVQRSGFPIPILKRTGGIDSSSGRPQKAQICTRRHDAQSTTGGAAA